MEDHDRENYHTKRKTRATPRGTSQRPPCSVFGDDFGDGFGGGKGKVKACISASGAPLVSASSRPHYKPDTALIISSAEESDSSDPLNLCSSQKSRTQSRSRRAASRSHRANSNTLERKHSTSRNERGMMHSPVRSALAFGKQRGNRVANSVPKKEQERRASQDLPLNAQVTGVPNRTVSSSRMQPASRAVTRPVASTSSSRVRRPQNSLSDLYSLATPVDNFSFPEFVQPRRSSRTQEESSVPLPDRLGMNQLRNEKRNKNLLPASLKGKGTTVSSTNFSSSTQASGSSRVSTRSERKRFESDGESSSQQLEEVPWADLVHFPSPLAPVTPKSSRTGTSKSSQSSFPMHLTPPDSRMKKQAILDELGKVKSYVPGSGSDRSRKRKLSSMNEAPDLSDECVIVFESQYCF